MNLDKFEQYTETENYIVYLEKNPLFFNVREIIIYYKKHNRYMRTLLNEQLFNLFFKPEDYIRVMGKEKTR